MRHWKVAEDSHLVYRGHKSNIDNVQILNEHNFASSSQDGNINVWKDSIKSPLLTMPAAHGYDGLSPRWVSSLAVAKMTNLIASGSNDGYVRLWNANVNDREISSLASFEIAGFVNGLSLTPNMLIAATGAEHRLGRWWNMKGNKNKIVVYRF